jgi:hypothetical protein
MEWLNFEFIKLIRNILKVEDTDEKNTVIVRKLLGITKNNKNRSLKEIFEIIGIDNYKLSILNQFKNNFYTDKFISSLFKIDNFDYVERIIKKSTKIKKIKLLLRRGNTLSGLTNFITSWEINPLIAPNQQYFIDPSNNSFDETFTILVTENPLQKIIGMQMPYLHLDIDDNSKSFRFSNLNKQYASVGMLSTGKKSTFTNFNMTRNYCINVLIKEFNSQSYKSVEGDYHFNFQPILGYPFTSTARALTLSTMSYGTKLIGSINPYSFAVLRNFKTYKAVNEGFYWFQTPYDNINRISVVLQSTFSEINRSYLDIDMVLTLFYLEESD